MSLVETLPALHVWPQPAEVSGGCLTHRARVEDREPFTLWFRVPEEHAPLLASRAESFAAATLFLAMRRGTELRVHAPLSPTFLRNLEEVQAIWCCWEPAFRRVAIVADSESESSVCAPARAISTFSGGVDSCYTVWRHTQKLCGRRARPLETALLIHGSEIELDRPEMFQRAGQRVRRLLSVVGVRPVTMATNFRSVMPAGYARCSLGSLLAAALLWFQESHSAGLIPASFSYHRLMLPYPSTPLCDPLYSTAGFAIEHDGADAYRTEKTREILPWPGLTAELRVCNEPGSADVNCGVCEKCIRTVLTLRLLGIETPACFPHHPTDQEIERLYLQRLGLEFMELLLQDARKAGSRAPWVASLEVALRRNQRRENWRPRLLKISRHVPRSLRPFWRALERRLFPS